MANVHGLGDYRNNNSNSGGGRPQGGGGGGMGQSLMGGGDPNNPFNAMFTRDAGVDPRKEKFHQMLHIYFCPRLTVKTFIFWITLADISMYILTLALTLADQEKLNPNVFLGPSYDILNIVGDKWPYKMRYLSENPLAIRRFFTPMILHLGFTHITSNMISQLIFGSMLESILGFYRMAIVYIAGGFGGILMSCVTNPETRAVGASTADFAIIGGILGAVIVHWKVFDAQPMVRCYLIFMVVIIVFINLMMNITSQGDINPPDIAGHVGGFLSGIMLAMALTPHMRQEAKLSGSQERQAKMIGSSAAIVYFLGMIIVFYTAITPQY